MAESDLKLVVVWLKTDEKCSDQALDGGIGSIDVTVHFQGWRLHNSRELKIAPGRNGALVIDVASPGQVGSRSRVAPASIPVCAFHGRQARRQEARRPQRPPEECHRVLADGKQAETRAGCIHVSLEWLLVMPKCSFLLGTLPSRTIPTSEKVVSPACSQEAVISHCSLAAAQPKPVT